MADTAMDVDDTTEIAEEDTLFYNTDGATENGSKDPGAYPKTDDAKEDEKKETKKKDPKDRPNAFHCKACDITVFGIISYEQHINGNRHKRTAEAAGITEDPYHAKTSNIDHKKHFGEYLEETTDVVIGVKYITEMKTDSADEPPSYVCNLCESVSNTSTIRAHVIGNKHRMNYLRDHYPEYYEDCKGPSDAPRKRSESTVLAEKYARIIEEKEGRKGLKTIVNNSVQFVNPSKLNKSSHNEEPDNKRMRGGGRGGRGGGRGGYDGGDRGYGGGRGRGRGGYDMDRGSRGGHMRGGNIGGGGPMPLIAGGHRGGMGGGPMGGGPMGGPMGGLGGRFGPMRGGMTDFFADPEPYETLDSLLSGLINHLERNTIVTEAEATMAYKVGNMLHERLVAYQNRKSKEMEFKRFRSAYGQDSSGSRRQGKHGGGFGFEDNSWHF